jgi:hypothetical protein
MNKAHHSVATQEKSVRLPPLMILERRSACSWL